MRDIAQDLMDRFAGFVRGHTSDDRAHPFVGVAFIAAALVVLLVGLRWFTDKGDATTGTTDRSWALDVSNDGPTTTIGASPEAVAVRVGTAVPRGAEDDSTVTIGIPGTDLEVQVPLGPTATTGPGTGGSPSTGGSSGGGSGGGGGGGTTPTTRRTTTSAPTDPTTTAPTDTTTTTEQTTTTSASPPTTDPPTTPPPPTEPSALDLAGLGGLIGGLAELLS